MARKHQDKRETFHVAAHPAFAGVRKKLESLARNSIRLKVSAVEDEDTLAIGSTKLGGRPDLPESVQWPSCHIDLPPASDAYRNVNSNAVLPEDGIVSLPFIGQFRMEDLAPYDVDCVLPKEGILYFFHNDAAFSTDIELQREDISEDPEASMDEGDFVYELYRKGLSIIRKGDMEYVIRQYDYLHPDRTRAIYLNEQATRLERKEFPSNLPGYEMSDYRFKACELEFWTEKLLPQTEVSVLEVADIWDDEDLQEQWVELISEVRGGVISQMLGYPDIGSHPVGVRYDLFPESKFTFEEATERQRLDQALDLRLLLQLDSDALDAMGWSNRRFYIFMRNQDLLKRDFSRLWTDTD